MGEIAKRSILLAGHKTSVSLEEEFWSALKEIAHENEMSVSALVLRVDRTRERGNLSSALRTFVLDHYRNVLAKQCSPSRAMGASKPNRRTPSRTNRDPSCDRSDP